MWTILRPFQRVTHGRVLLPEIDGLRFIAIMSVVFFHLDVQMWPRCPEVLRDGLMNQALHAVLSLGNFGVPLFFGISGFILSQPMMRGHGEKISMSEYYMRRLTRIEPPYVINMCLLALAYVVLEGKSLSDVGLHLMASLLYLHNLVFGAQSTLNSVAWSLEVEVQFYLLAPFLVIWLLAQGVCYRVWLILAISIAGGVAEAMALIPVLSLLTVIQYFLVGVLVADLYSRGGADSRILKWAGRDFVVLLVLAVYACIRFRASEFQGVACWALIFSFLSSALAGGQLKKLLGYPLVYVIGGMCYTIYLWHGPVWRKIWHTAFGTSIGDQYWLYYFQKAAFFVPCILIVSAVLFLLFEKPFMHRGWPRMVANFVRRIFARPRSQAL